MRSLFNGLLQLRTYSWILFTAALGIAAATVDAYLRKQIHDAINWVLAPVTRRMPWNADRPELDMPPEGAHFTAKLSIVDVFLLSADGRRARYRKTSAYKVLSGDLHSYKEGVTSAGSAATFTTSCGVILSTVKEHGFYVSEIDLGDVFREGDQFINIYGADLYDCFTSYVEHWTQEIAIPTEHLILQVHFPEDRAPVLVRCKVVQGLSEVRTTTAAKLVDVAGLKALVWDVPGPKLKYVYKLEWVW